MILANSLRCRTTTTSLWLIYKLVMHHLCFVHCYQFNRSDHKFFGYTFSLVAEVSPTSIELGLLILRQVLDRSIVGVLVLSVYCANTKEMAPLWRTVGRKATVKTGGIDMRWFMHHGSMK